MTCCLKLLIAVLMAVAVQLAGAADCGNGASGIISGNFCCAASCGSCGGHNCHKRPGGDTDCCTSKITTSCATSKKAPCLIKAVTPAPDTNKCAAGEKTASGVCCPSSCTVCGGSHCNTKPNTYTKCCVSEIKKANKKCSATQKAPCVLSTAVTPVPAPTPAKAPVPTPVQAPAGGGLTPQVKCANGQFCQLTATFTGVFVGDQFTTCVAANTCKCVDPTQLFKQEGAAFNLGVCLGPEKVCSSGDICGLAHSIAGSPYTTCAADICTCPSGKPYVTTTSFPSGFGFNIRIGSCA